MTTTARQKKITEVLKKRQKFLTVVFYNIHDPHNISAILRTCDAVGIPEVHIINTIESKKNIRLGKKSSASAIKWVKVNHYNNVKSCIDKLKDLGYNIYSTYLNNKSNSLYELDLTEKIALVFGNEHTGVSEEIMTMSDKNFIIPQVGMIPSLNVSVACGVCLYEAFRQRNLNQM